MKINFSEDGKLAVDVKFEENELDWAKNNANSFDNLINSLKEVLIISSNNEKERRNAILPPIIKGIETINNISNNLYNYYTDQNSEEIPDLPYK